MTIARVSVVHGSTCMAFAGPGEYLMLYRVKGVDHSGRAFASRFESRSEAELRQWMIENGIAVTAVGPLPLTTGPYSKLPWLILAFPVLVATFLYLTVGLVKSIASGQINWVAFIVTLFLDCALAILIYNILLRLGSHYSFDEGRISQYTKGDSIATSEGYADSSENG